MQNIENNYDVVIVGAGASGLTTAAYLSKYGYRVLLCEQSNEIGGLVKSFNYNGFIFDGGIRAFENSGIIFPMLKQLGIDIEFVSNPISIGIKADVIELKSKESLKDYEALLIKYFRENSEDINKIIFEIKKVMTYMDVLYGIDNPLFLDFRDDKKYIFKTLLPWLFRYYKNMSKVNKLVKPINEYLKRFTNNQALIDMITQHFFKNTPTFFALSYFSLYLDYSYPMGGTGVLPQKLSSYILDHKGIIINNTKITKIDVKHNQVMTSDGKIFNYKKLVWACDAKQLYKSIDLSDEKSSKKIKKQKKLVNSNVGADSVVSVYLGIDLEKNYFQDKGGEHSFYTASTVGISNNNLNNIDVKLPKEELKSKILELLNNTTYEISCPVLRDSSLAPANQTGLIISTLMDYHLVKEIRDAGWYDEFKDICSKKIIDIMDETIFKGIKSKVIFSFTSTPLTIERMTGNSDGAIVGWAFSGGKLPSETRLTKIASSIFTPIPNVYQVGQ